MKKSVLSGALAGVLLCGVSGGAVLAQTQPSDRCDTETVQSMAPAETTVSFAAREGAGCRVVGYVTTRDPGPNKVLFNLTLPNRFAGRYVYLGVGGAAGNLPVPRQELVAKGFAVSGSDGGSGAKSLSDFTFKSDPGKLADFLGRGVHVVAQATQQITKNYYNQKELRRYISGCSGGGQMGLTNALRFAAQDFDGFVVGATPWPGYNVFKPNAMRLVQHQQLNPDAWISPELLKKADAAILAAYDGTDGAVDGIIADQRNIKEFDLDILRKIGFTPAQITMFDMVRKPARFTLPGGGTAEQPGYPFTDVESWSYYIFGQSAPPWPSTEKLSSAEVQRRGAPYFHAQADTNTRATNPKLDYWTVTKEADRTKLAMTAGGEAVISDTASADAAFKTFAASGAKLIVYHGVDDDAMSYLETVQSYDALKKKHANTDNWLRAFTFPGTRHCGGGPGTSNTEEPLIDALVSWVEKGEAPQSVIAERVTRTKGLERTFRVCAEPSRGFLKAPGADPTKAENWECRTPDAKR